jgi:hypothetical protein
MAERKTFPMLPGGHWWTLREKFKQSIPAIVTDSYLAAVLKLTVESAHKNVLPYLKDIGLIDDEGKTHQELAKAWRDDSQYPDVCAQLRERIYPQELLVAVPDPRQDREGARRWFANHTGVGVSAVARMLQFYIILAEADASMKPVERSAKAADSSKGARTTRKPQVTRLEEIPAAASQPTASQSPAQEPGPVQFPAICINLEIHISADASLEQIEKIFESMARHIYKR